MKLFDSTNIPLLGKALDVTDETHIAQGGFQFRQLESLPGSVEANEAEAIRTYNSYQRDGAKTSVKLRSLVDRKG
ncbi:MAG: hypothetical protein AAB209_10700 [Bacteroidota bacterium]|jgi:hypothetical protein